jgi:hypothetical protein
MLPERTIQPLRMARKRGLFMAEPECPEITAEPISIIRCRELLGDEDDGWSGDEVREVMRHAEAMARILILMALQDAGVLLTAMARRRTLPAT